MICKPCANAEHERCVDKVSPETGEPRILDYRGCDCAHVVRQE